MAKIRLRVFHSQDVGSTIRTASFISISISSHTNLYISRCSPHSRHP